MLSLTSVLSLDLISMACFFSLIGSLIRLFVASQVVVDYTLDIVVLTLLRVWFVFFCFKNIEFRQAIKVLEDPFDPVEACFQFC